MNNLEQRVPPVVMTDKRHSEAMRNAFNIGQESGRSKHGPPVRSAPVRHLHAMH